MMQGTVTEMFSHPGGFQSGDVVTRSSGPGGGRRSAEARRFRGLVEELLELWLVGPSGALLYVTPSAARRFADSGIAEPTRPAAELIHPDERADWRALIADLLRRPGLVRVASFRQPGRDGSWRPAEVRLRNRLDDSDTAAIVVEWRGAEDVWLTARSGTAEVEQHVAVRTAELAAVNRELEAFCYSVSHDLRAPLRGIEGFSRLLLEEHGSALDADGRGCAERIHAAARHMHELLEALLDLAGVTRAPMQRGVVDLSAIADAIVARLRACFPQRQVEVDIAAGMQVEGDPRLLHIALENLLDNAWKYTGRHPTARIQVGVLHEGAGPIFYVRDDGAGFVDGEAGRLFGAFQRLHRREEFDGTGIGLATVQRIIHRHGGRVWASGAVERGATFYFTLGA
jgi:signal transduction histidine kinase